MSNRVFTVSIEPKIEIQSDDNDGISIDKKITRFSKPVDSYPSILEATYQDLMVAMGSAMYPIPPPRIGV